ncbi:hypothetical protein [Sulfurospirillum diekertiae]|uniref:Uncharacterized protein n=1 Tax=Sulfurospirillum diekertiae TaxID=1854492 RepID=A0A1Y0HHX6_9BACT|nr:hypothetical protein [Sulfurospirillum diekertiae]ARU47570.1 hypothetical protein Sdiek1_0388 [Sulfurospirillum diekertiae]ASC92418.1 hypothetical protein Sdiek2_0381 [Sulfurospirillum diekertiae]
MAERRMFARTIIDSDIFLDMPISAQCLYFHLGMRADDDGFVNNPKKIMRMINARDDDMRILFVKSFIVGFESGVIVVAHWRIHNYIQKDRYKPTNFCQEKALLYVAENNVYSLDTKCIHVGYTGKDSLELNRPLPSKVEEFENEIVITYPRYSTTVGSTSILKRKPNKKGNTSSFEGENQGIPHE